jgi:two-component system, LuxR family, response regulator FixJ
MTDAAGTVFVVDDDGPALDSLVMLLQSDGLRAEGFASASSFLEAFHAEMRGCVVTDLQMPGLDGIELIRAMRAAGAALPVLVITGHSDVSRAVDAMKAGARDFIEKPYDAEVLLRAVRACLEEHDAAVDASATRNRVLRRLESLTARERQVLALIVEGSSNKEIGRTLSISPRTVEIYRANVMSKMRADSLSELVRLTLAAGMP